ncbi:MULTISPECIES: VOC family protein [Rhodococcus]|uniref:Glyoxalase/bleomycin resistance protein/dioxygenase superfamily protein n=2 Tax=Nocardiaceae TaxID=85025 RepID=A0A652YY90_NOCGL|nr:MULTISPECIES: VOC family protein [Rhodococcus]NMD58989.1 glyoxalase [Nocardia globerula]NRI66083.1 glyoxalase [Rhodococcus sp. MS16]MCE4266828.1 VOC family protein [Rhodococcus globerulus]MDV6267356.1 VOC family protein [Rhodococcus globerulus]PVX64944.1 glyoxalase/bleomycin resistance protein/dioxygenase superfamily protein [Rhodococcus globerulus]
MSVSPRLDLVGIVTTDLDRSLAFYRSLGLDIPETPSDAPHVEFTFGNGLRLAWDAESTIKSFDPEYATVAGRHPVALAFDFGTPAAVDEAYKRITTDFPGHKEPFDAVWGQRYAVLLDPDGNTVDLFAAL